MTAEVVAASTGRVRQFVWVACENTYCTNFGAQRQLWLSRVAYGFVQIPQVLCEACGMSPQMCIWEGESAMPKIHVGREPTYADQIPQTPAQSAPVAGAVGEVEPEVASLSEGGEVVNAAAEASAPAKTRKSTLRKKAN